MTIKHLKSGGVRNDNNRRFDYNSSYQTPRKGEVHYDYHF